MPSPIGPRAGGVDRRARSVEPFVTLAELYDHVLGERFFRAFERLAQRHRIHPNSVADVACGTGMFVRYLRQSGASVVYGVDRSAEMLCVAVNRNKGNGARFLLQDFLSLRLPSPVDLITCHFDSLNYLLTTDQLLEALRRFRSNLKPGGHLLFDMVTERALRPTAAPKIERVAGSSTTLTRVTHTDRRLALQLACICVSRNGRTAREVHVQRAYPVATITRLLRISGYPLVGVYDYESLGRVTDSTVRAAFVARSPLTPTLESRTG
jgi:SAM-dependent methyltransferase